MAFNEIQWYLHIGHLLNFQQYGIQRNYIIPHVLVPPSPLREESDSSDSFFILYTFTIPIANDKMRPRDKLSPPLEN